MLMEEKFENASAKRSRESFLRKTGLGRVMSDFLIVKNSQAISGPQDLGFLNLIPKSFIAECNSRSALLATGELSKELAETYTNIYGVTLPENPKKYKDIVGYHLLELDPSTKLQRELVSQVRIRRSEYLRLERKYSIIMGNIGICEAMLACPPDEEELPDYNEILKLKLLYLSALKNTVELRYPAKTCSLVVRWRSHLPDTLDPQGRVVPDLKGRTFRDRNILAAQIFTMIFMWGMQIEPE